MAQQRAADLPIKIAQQANVSVNVEPEENGKLVYAHIAQSLQNGADGAKLAPILIIKNNGAWAVVLEKATVEFFGPPFALPIDFDVNVTINPGSEETIHLQDHPDYVDGNGEYDNYTIRLPHPTPVAVNFVLQFSGYPEPTEVYRQLAKHANDAPKGRYRFPGKSSDLDAGQYWSGHSDWVTGKHGGNERFAYDIGVRGWNPDDDSWSRIIPGTTGCQNEDWLVWDKPIYAIADGVVELVTDDKADRLPTYNNCGGTASNGTNMIRVRYGDEVVRYLHLKQNSAEVAPGDSVQAGDMLARIGNSGKSSNPHLHIDVRKDSHLRPLHFGCSMALDWEKIDLASVASEPWAELDGHALPWEDSLIWPSPDSGYTEVARHGIKASDFQNIFTNITACGYMPVWVDGYDVQGVNYFNAIFRPAFAPWVARHGLTSTQYQDEFDHWTNQGYRLLQVESYRQDNRIRYAVIFVRQAGPDQVAYHGRTETEHQAEFDQMVVKGYRPVNISVVSINGYLSYTALYEKSGVGKWRAKSFLTPAEYQNEYEQNDADGRQLVYLQAYNHNGAVRFSAIWYPAFSSAIAARHGMTSEEYQEEWEQWTGSEYLTRGVTGYEQDSASYFAAFWW